MTQAAKPAKLSVRHPKLKLEDVQKLAEDKGGRCLSTECRINTAKLRFTCREGHIFEATGAVIQRGVWCKRCADEKKRLPLDLFREVAATHGGECLSDEYEGINGEKLVFRCVKGHTFEMTGGCARQGHWCKRCFTESRMLSLDVFREAAASHGGECLSDVYEGRQKKLRFRCGKGHFFEMAGAMIQRGQWCKRCFTENRMLSLDVFREAAATHGGECLSEVYEGVFKKLAFRCSNGHTFETRGACVIQGKWCRRCHAEKMRLSLDVYREAAAAHGGECLSETNEGRRKKLRFRCGRGHIFETTGVCILQGRWCPGCQTGRGERECMAFVESRTGLCFPKARPEWLRFKRRCLELDGLSMEGGVAVEYQGGQHFGFVPGFFHRTEADFHYQLERDRWKAEQTALQGILLLAVPASDRSDSASVQSAVVKAAEESCFPLLGVNREYTEMVRDMYPTAAFSACLPLAEFWLFCGT